MFLFLFHQLFETYQSDFQLGDGMRLLFEAGDLKQASPATVSRCGMVYMDPKELGWRPYVRHWIGTVPKAVRTLIRRFNELITSFYA